MAEDEVTVDELTLPIWRLKGVTMRALCEDFALGVGKVTQKHIAVKLFEEANLATLETLPTPPPSSPQRKSSRNVPKRERDKHVIPNGTITLPVERIKAETMRLICKDFGVSGAGKKPEAAKRLADSGKLDELSPPESSNSNPTPPVTPKRSQKRKSEAGADTLSAKPPSPKRRKTKTTRASKKTEGVLDDDAMEEVGNLDPADIPDANENEVVMDDGEGKLPEPEAEESTQPPVEEAAMEDSIAESFSLHADYKPAPAVQPTSPIIEDKNESEISPVSDSLVPTPSGDKPTALNEKMIEEASSGMKADIEANPEANEAVSQQSKRADTDAAPEPSVDVGASAPQSVDDPKLVVERESEVELTSDELADVTTEPIVEPATPVVDKGDVNHDAGADEIAVTVQEETAIVGNFDPVTHLVAATTTIIDDSAKPLDPPVHHADNLMDVDIPSMSNGTGIAISDLLTPIPSMDPAVLVQDSNNISIPPPQFPEPDPQPSSMHGFFAPVQVFERSTSTNGNVAELIEGGEGGIRKSLYFGASTTS